MIRTEIDDLLSTLPHAAEEEAIHEAMISVGELVREWRRAMGLTQELLSERTRISKSTIARIEVGGIPRGPRLETIARLLFYCHKKLSIDAKDVEYIRPVKKAKSGKGMGNDKRSKPSLILHTSSGNSNEGGNEGNVGKPSRILGTSRYKTPGNENPSK